MSAVASTLLHQENPLPTLAIRHYPVTGTRLLAEPLVLIHGWACDSRTWEPLLPRLQQFCQVITVDLPGFGNSECLLDDYALGAVMAALMEQMPSHAAYMGWSLGGMLATALAGHYPKRVTHVITLASNVRFAAGEGDEPALPGAIYQQFVSSFAQSPAATLKRFCGLMAQGDDNERLRLKQLRQLNAQCSARSEEVDNPNWLQALSLLGQIDNRGFAQHLQQPGLHLLADGDALVPVAAQENLTGGLQSCQIIERSCHALHWSQPQRVAEAIEAFFQRQKHHLDKRKVAESFSRAAPTYDAVAELQRGVGEHLLDLLEAHPTKDSAEVKQVVDLGCGTGCFSPRLAQIYPQADLLGLDIAEGMLRYAREKRQLDAAWLCADAENLPLADNSVDLLFSSLAIQWCENLPALFGEMQRILKPGGRAFISTLGPRTLHELKAAWQTVDGYTHVNRFLPAASLQQAQAEAGLSERGFYTEDRVLQYEQLRELTHELKALGAHNVNSGQSAGLTGRRRLQQFRKGYETFRRNGKLPATYEVYYWVLSKD